MRSRKEIEKECKNGEVIDEKEIELLLDVRDLLQEIKALLTRGRRR